MPRKSVTNQLDALVDRVVVLGVHLAHCLPIHAIEIVDACELAPGRRIHGDMSSCNSVIRAQ